MILFSGSGLKACENLLQFAFGSRQATPAFEQEFRGPACKSRQAVDVAVVAAQSGDYLFQFGKRLAIAEFFDGIWHIFNSYFFQECAGR